MDSELLERGWRAEGWIGKNGPEFSYSKGEHKDLNEYQAWSIENYPDMAVEEDSKLICVSCILWKTRDGKWHGYPEYADYMHIIEDTKADVIREILSRTADLYEED
jgi:hypothetical protein